MFVVEFDGTVRTPTYQERVEAYEPYRQKRVKRGSPEWEQEIILKELGPYYPKDWLYLLFYEKLAKLLFSF
jgi:hypothetical protein